jgi:hypothetical protein
MEKRKYVQDKNWRAYNVSFFSQGSGRVVTSCDVFEQWISAVVLSKLQTLQTTFAVLCCCPNYKTTFKIILLLTCRYLCFTSIIFLQLFFYLQCCRYLLLVTFYKQFYIRIIQYVHTMLKFNRK